MIYLKKARELIRVFDSTGGLLPNESEEEEENSIELEPQTLVPRPDDAK